MGYRRKKTKKKRKKKQSGGNCINCMTITLLFFIGLIYLTGVFDYGKTIDDYIKITDTDMGVSESLGVGLIQYDTKIHRILNDMINTIGSDSDPFSYNVRLNDNLQINDIEPYLTEDRIQNEKYKYDNEPQSIVKFGTSDFPTSRNLYGYYDSRQYAKEYRKNWMETKNTNQSFLRENDINILLEKFMPKILNMSDSGVPTNIEINGVSTIISRGILESASNFHQDISETALLGSATADNDYRVMIFDRDDSYDTSWTDIATSIDDKNANKYIKTSFGKYDFARLLDFDIDKSKYIALVFDNNKVFHRTPPTTLWKWAFDKSPKQRRVTQIRIAWDDYEQVNESFEEIMDGGGYVIR